MIYLCTLYENAINNCRLRVNVISYATQSVNDINLNRTYECMHNNMTIKVHM